MAKRRRRKAATRTRTVYRTAPRRRSSRKKSAFDMNLLWLGLGAGSSGVLGGLVNKVAPQLAGNLASGLGGLALMQFTKGKARQVGKGAVIKAIGDLVEENVIPRIGGGSFLGTPGSPSGSGW